LMRWRGMRAFADLRQGLKNMGNPVSMVADQAVFMLAGVLLILPGFLTDMLGLLLLLPPIRYLLVAMAARRVILRAAPTGRRNTAANEDVIDGEYTHVPQDPASLRRPSGWTQD
ncbi:MAG: FxsA family protein, partial [Paracoccaceae bacterium]